jgi:hypothetical protein
MLYTIRRFGILQKQTKRISSFGLFKLRELRKQNQSYLEHISKGVKHYYLLVCYLKAINNELLNVELRNDELSND